MPPTRGELLLGEQLGQDLGQLPFHIVSHGGTLDNVRVRLHIIRNGTFGGNVGSNISFSLKQTRWSLTLPIQLSLYEVTALESH